MAWTAWAASPWFPSPSATIPPAAPPTTSPCTPRSRAAWWQDRDIWSTQVDIKVVQCNVVLLGLVARQRDADAIVGYANAEEGVRTVQNLIRIQR